MLKVRRRRVGRRVRAKRGNEIGTPSREAGAAGVR